MPKGIWSEAVPRPCLVCSSSYLPVRKTQKFCSHKCGLTQATRSCSRCEQVYTPTTRRRTTCGPACPGRPLESRNCLQCGSGFKARHGGGNFANRYCSEKCRHAASRVRLGERFRKYALDELEYLSVVDAQGNRCASCGEPPTRSDRYGLVVDHDHRTGVVRGLLCNPCNMGLGLFQDDTNRLMGAVAYLIQHSGQPVVPSREVQAGTASKCADSEINSEETDIGD